MNNTSTSISEKNNAPKQETMTDKTEQKLVATIRGCSEQEPEKYLRASTELIDYYLNRDNFDKAEKLLTDNIGYCVNLGVEDKSIGLLYAQRALVRTYLGKNELVADDICTTIGMNGGYQCEDIIRHIAMICPNEVIRQLRKMVAREPQNIAWHIGLGLLYRYKKDEYKLNEQTKILAELMC